MEERVYHSLSCRQLPYGKRQGEGLGVDQHHHAVLLLCEKSSILVHIFFDYTKQTSTLQYLTLDAEGRKTFSENWSVFGARNHVELGTKVRDIVQRVQGGNGGAGDKYDLLSNNCQHVSGNIQRIDYWSRTLSECALGINKKYGTLCRVRDYITRTFRAVQPLEAEEILQTFWERYSGKMFLPESMGGKLAETMKHGADVIANPARGVTFAASACYACAYELLDRAESLWQDMADLARMLPSLQEEQSELRRLHQDLERDLGRGAYSEMLLRIRDLRTRYEAVQLFVQTLLKEASKKKRQAEEQKQWAETARNVMWGLAAVSLIFWWCPAAFAASRGGAAVVAAGEAAAVAAAGEAAAAAATAEAAVWGTGTILFSSAVCNEAANMNDVSRERAGEIVRDMDKHLVEVDGHLRDLERGLERVTDAGAEGSVEKVPWRWTAAVCLAFGAFGLLVSRRWRVAVCLAPRLLVC